MAIKTAKELTKLLQKSGTYTTEEELKMWAGSIVDEIWKGYDLALSPEDQQMVDNILERVKSQL